MNINVGNIIDYNFLFSNEQRKVGLVTKIKKDKNFSYIIYVVVDNQIEMIPYSMLDYRVVN